MNVNIRSSKENEKITAVSKSILILLFTLGIAGIAAAHPLTDTSKKTIPATVDKKEAVVVAAEESNVVFPEVLTGNEDETLEYIEKFSENRRAYVIRTYNRGKSYFPKVSAILKKYDLPDELKMLMALESAFNANAVSRAGAVGYWQFMDDVAKEYGLKYTPRHRSSTKIIHTKKGKVVKKTIVKKAGGRDDRKNFNKSTHAAARYLKDRSRNLNNNLLLMVASYNCGVGNVWEAMKKTGKSDPDFWDIKNYLPSETRAYVMNFITLNVLFHNYDKFTGNSLNFTPAKIQLDDLEENIAASLDEAYNLK